MEHVTQPAKQSVTNLREATRSLHGNLETDSQVLARLKLPVERAHLINCYIAMLVQASEILRPWLSSSEMFLQDMEDRVCGSYSAVATAPVLAYQAEALGFDYVMKGSALGGRMILRELGRDGVSIEGLGFLDPYGSRTGEVWRQVLDRLESVVRDDSIAYDRALSGARKAYSFARHYLCGKDRP